VSSEFKIDKMIDEVTKEPYDQVAIDIETEDKQEDESL